MPSLEQIKRKLERFAKTHNDQTLKSMVQTIEVILKGDTADDTVASNDQLIQLLKRDIKSQEERLAKLDEELASLLQRLLHNLETGLDSDQDNPLSSDDGEQEESDVSVSDSENEKCASHYQFIQAELARLLQEQKITRNFFDIYSRLIEDDDLDVEDLRQYSACLEVSRYFLTPQRSDDMAQILSKPDIAEYRLIENFWNCLVFLRKFEFLTNPEYLDFFLQYAKTGNALQLEALSIKLMQWIEQAGNVFKFQVVTNFMPYPPFVPVPNLQHAIPLLAFPPPARPTLISPSPAHSALNLQPQENKP